jgi:hypothetical protein
MTFDEQVAKLLDLDEKTDQWKCFKGITDKTTSVTRVKTDREGYSLSVAKFARQDEAEIATMSRNIAPELGRRYKRMREVLEHSKTEITTAVEDCEVESVRATQHAKMVLKMLLIKLEEIDV